MEWTGLEPQQVYDHWDELLPLIEKSLERGHGEYLPVDVLELISIGEAQVWVVYEPGPEITALVITRLVVFPRKRTAMIFLVAGERLDEWIHLMGDVIEPWARVNHCTEIRGTGRDGWWRKMKSHGWDKLYTIVGKEL